MDTRLPQLPSELLSQIFFEVDPHTLYTSIRCLSRQWKSHVEGSLLRSEFHSGNWRVGLRVTRKPKVGKPWRGGIAGEQGELAPGAAWSRIREEAEATASDSQAGSDPDGAAERAAAAYTRSLLTREGTLEDELPSEIQGEASAALVHVVPLQFKAYDTETTTLHFDTGSDAWHAVFENSDEQDNQGSGRLDLDFSIVWRFPGDGQSDADLDGWGAPDQENGWLSRFYCSSLDTTCGALQDEERGSGQMLHSSPLARRVRKRQVSLQQEFHNPELNSDSSFEWSDEGHEYLSLSLSLGTEFFVRRSARANFLMRRLEAEAKADNERVDAGDGQRRDRRVYMPSSPLMTPCHSTRYSPLRTAGHPVARFRGACGTGGEETGTSTPVWSLGARRGASYAAVASTPPSGCSSPVGTPLAMRSKGPRVVRVQQQAEPSGSGSRAPMPSANVSGYSSVKHQARIDDKEAEAASANLGLSPSSSALSNSSTCSPRRDMAGHGSVPRAHFCARLLRSSPGLSWQEMHSKAPFRHSAIDTPLTVWEWTR